ncbi:MAG: class I SAM-dependent methyltransferase [Chloroflexi bacterium]|nr:class I SAM-dependent methyltransferase [Chloroflexota bacterium]
MLASAADKASAALAIDPADPWSATAPFYDLDLEGVEEDIALYRELAERQGGAVLELGCGTGRVAIPLAAAGLEVTGVDASPRMLAVAQERAQAAGARVRLLQGDMRALQLRRRFATVLVPFGGLQHLDNVDDIVATLASAEAHLVRGGLVAVDVEAPQPEDLAPGPQPLVAHWTRTWGDALVTKLVAVEGRPALGLREVAFHYDVQSARGPLRRWTHQFTLRVITPGELQLAARLARLELVALYGDYALTPLDDGAGRIVALFRRAARARAAPARA